MPQTTVAPPPLDNRGSALWNRMSARAQQPGWTVQPSSTSNFSLYTPHSPPRPGCFNVVWKTFAPLPSVLRFFYFAGTECVYSSFPYAASQMSILVDHGRKFYIKLTSSTQKNNSCAPVKGPYEFGNACELLLKSLSISSVLKSLDILICKS